MGRNRGRPLLVGLALLLILLPLSLVGPLKSQTSGASTGWQASSFPFRESITVTNPSNQSFTNEPVLVDLSFRYSQVSDASTETRIFSNASELPSFVVDETRSGPFVVSASILFFANLSAGGSQIFWLYYGDVLAQNPAYRPHTISTSVSIGLLSSAEQSPRPGSTLLQFTFGGTYSETLQTKYSYFGTTQEDFGSLGISQNPTLEISPRMVVGNITQQEVGAIAATSTAPGLKITSTDVLNDSEVIRLIELHNTSTSPLSGLTITSLVDASQLATVGPSYTQIFQQTGALITNAGATYVGYQTGFPLKSYTVGPPGVVINETLSGNFTKRSSAYGQAAAALSWGVGDLSPGASTVLRFVWAVSSDPLALQRKLGAAVLSPTVAVGNEQILSSRSPAISLYWSGSVPVVNTPLSSSGLQVPLNIRNLGPKGLEVWLPRTVAFDGTINYLTPAPHFGTSQIGYWSKVSLNQGNATSLASPAFYSLADSGYVGLISTSTGNSSSAGLAELVSNRQVVFGDESPTLNFNYNGALSGTGNSAGVSVFAALDLDHRMSGTYEQTIVFPLIGTQLNSTACSLQTISTASPQNLTLGGYITADGTWRSDSASLEPWAGPQGFAFRLRFCVIAANGFVGSAQLKLGLAGVGVSLNGQGVVSASMDSSAPNIRITYAPGYSFIPVGAKLDGNLNFSLVATPSVYTVGGDGFGAAVGGAPVIRINRTSAMPMGGNASTSLTGISVSTQYASMDPQLLLGNSPVGSPQLLGGTLFYPPWSLASAWGDTGSSTTVTLGFDSPMVRLRVLDTNGDAVSGANIAISTSSQALVNNVTNPSGIATFRLVPWNYSILVLYQGSQVVGTTPLPVNQSQTLDLEASVYSISLKVIDNLGSPMADMLVSLTPLSGPLIQGVTSSQGTFTFQGAANSEFHLVLSRAGTTYYDGKIVASVNNGIVLVHTSQYPEELLLAVLGAVVASTGSAITFYLFRIRRKLGKKQ